EPLCQLGEPGAGLPPRAPWPPITAALQARSVNCHLLPDQYYLAPRTACHSTTEG
ncbi:hypothetical protein KUCAC02_011360, partial [Chaenocephalus aceratus]